MSMASVPAHLSGNCERSRALRDLRLAVRHRDDVELALQHGRLEDHVLPTDLPKGGKIGHKSTDSGYLVV